MMTSKELREAREVEYLGRRVRAVHFTTENSSLDDNQTVPPGTEGIVRSVDDVGTLSVDWENGSRIGVLVQDTVEIIESGEALDRSIREVTEAYDRLKPILHCCIREAVEQAAPGLEAIHLEPTDQGGPGWVYMGPDDRLYDEDGLSELLGLLGEVYSSEDHPNFDYVIAGPPPWEPPE